MRKLSFLFLLFHLNVLSLFSQSFIVWGNQETQQVVKTDFNNGTTLILDENQTKIRRIKIDQINKLIFWTVANQRSIKCSDYNGTIVSVINVNYDINVIALNPYDSIIYFAENDNNVIEVCNYNGENRHPLIFGVSMVMGLDVDLQQKYLFWSEQYTGTIKRCNVDGSDVVVLYSNAEYLFDLELDTVNKEIYFSDRFENKISKIDYSGNNYSKVLNAKNTIGVVVSDPYNEELYWVEGSIGKIYKAGYDGNNKEVVIQTHMQDYGNISGFDVFLDAISLKQIMPYNDENVIFYSNKLKTLFWKIMHNSSFNIRVYNINGQMIYNEKSSTSEGSIYFSDLIPGIYTVIVVSDGKILNSRKVIVN